MIQHHPGDDLLLSLATGRMSTGAGVLASVHLEGCGECRARLHTLQSLGGCVLEDAQPQAPATDAWERTLARIDAPVPATVAAATAPSPASWPSDVQWPASLRGCSVSKWHWMGPGMRFARVQVPRAREGAMFLLRIGPGRSLPRHSHHGTELTQVLCGSFDDSRAVFATGDFDDADTGLHHQPVVRAGEECICLAYLDAPLRFDGRIAAMIGGWVGL